MTSHFPENYKKENMMKKFIIAVLTICLMAMSAMALYAAGPTGNYDLTKMNSGNPTYLPEAAYDVQLGNLLNSDGWSSIAVTFTQPATEMTVTHALGAVPNVVIITMTSPGQIYEYKAPDTLNVYISDTTTAQTVTSATIYFRAANQVQN